ncbi:MAG: hypothetical protein ACE5FI_11820 [Anaerolineales bacterium]
MKKALSILIAALAGNLALTACGASQSGAADRVDAPMQLRGAAQSLKRAAAWQTGGELGGVAMGPGGEVYVNINQSHRIVKYQ